MTCSERQPFNSTVIQVYAAPKDAQERKLCNSAIRTELDVHQKKWGMNCYNLWDFVAFMCWVKCSSKTRKQMESGNSARHDRKWYGSNRQDCSYVKFLEEKESVIFKQRDNEKEMKLQTPRGSCDRWWREETIWKPAKFPKALEWWLS